MIHITHTERKFLEDILTDALDYLRSYEDEKTGIPFGDFDFEERLEQALEIIRESGHVELE